MQTANGYEVTVQGALAVTEWLLANAPAGGYYTPAQLLGAGLVEGGILPGSTSIRVTETSSAPPILERSAALLH